MCACVCGGGITYPFLSFTDYQEKMVQLCPHAKGEKVFKSLENITYVRFHCIGLGERVEDHG